MEMCREPRGHMTSGLAGNPLGYANVDVMEAAFGVLGCFPSAGGPALRIAETHRGQDLQGPAHVAASRRYDQALWAVTARATDC